jgi:hypothetical protein
MITLRVSTLEAFRRAVETDYGSEEELQASIRRGQWEDGPSSWKMRAGTAWHEILCANLATEPTVVIPQLCQFAVCRGEYFFALADAMAGQDYRPRGLLEVPARQVLLADGQKMALHGQADHVRGLEVRDAKTCFAAPDPTDYESSLQWRCYLYLFGANVFSYDLYYFSEPTDLGYLALKDIYTFRQWRYPRMEEDLASWIRRFLAWAEGRGLTPFLQKDKPKAA